MKRNILQRLIAAYKAKRPVDLKQVASLGLMSIPISIIQANRSIRSATKSSMILSFDRRLTVHYCAATPTS